MTFLSTLAIIIAVLLMVFGVNLSGKDVTPVDQPIATQIVETVTAVPETADLPEATGASDVIQEVVTEAPVTEAPITPEPVITTEPTEAPTEIPVTPEPAPTIVNTVIVTEAEAVSDAQTLTTGLFTSVIDGSKYALPQFIEDNANTHLAARWVDYKTAQLNKSGTALKAFKIPGIEPSRKSMYSEGSLLVYEIDCKVSTVTDADADYVENLTYTLKYARDEAGNNVIKAIDIAGDADYDALKLALSGTDDITAIDAYVDAQIVG